jgi:hypothetical protein
MRTFAVVAGVVLRIGLTPLLLLARGRTGWLALFLLLLDLTDSVTATLLSCTEPDLKRAACHRGMLETSLPYQIADKWVDVLQYAVALAVVSISWGGLQLFLWCALAWRAIGVARFTKTHDPRVLVLHVDVIKEVLVMVALLQLMNCIHWLNPLMLGAVCAGKVLFEMWKNGKMVQWE